MQNTSALTVKLVLFVIVLFKLCDEIRVFNLWKHCNESIKLIISWDKVRVKASRLQRSIYKKKDNLLTFLSVHIYWTKTLDWNATSPWVCNLLITITRTPYDVWQNLTLTACNNFTKCVTFSSWTSLELFMASPGDILDNHFPTIRFIHACYKRHTH